MKSVDILYFIEHTARELDIACAVKAIAEKKYNISIAIASIFVDLQDTLNRYQPKVVALPYCVSAKDLGVKPVLAKWPDARYINLTFEQILGSTQKKLQAPKDEFGKSYVLHHAWGEFFATYLKENGVLDSQIIVNGNPSYSLYQEPYQAYYGHPRKELAQQFNLDPDKRWIFIPENYGWAFFRDNMIRDRIRRGFDPNHAYLYRDFARDSLQAAGRWWCDAAQLDSVELIVRPRPAIPEEYFIETLTNMTGGLPEALHIIKHGTVREWILASDVIISSYSTTLLEAAVAQKPIFMLMPYPFPNFLYAEWYEMVEKIENREVFLDIITRETINENWKIVEKWIIRHMMSKGDAIANLADMFAAILDGKIVVPRPTDIVRQNQNFSWANIISRVKKSGWRLMQAGLHILGVATKDQLWNPHEKDTISSLDVKRRVSQWEQILVGNHNANG